MQAPLEPIRKNARVHLQTKNVQLLLKAFLTAWNVVLGGERQPEPNITMTVVFVKLVLFIQTSWNCFKAKSFPKIGGAMAFTLKHLQEVLSSCHWVKISCHKHTLIIETFIYMVHLLNTCSHLQECLVLQESTKNKCDLYN